MRGEEEEGQGGRWDRSLRKEVSCWETGGESWELRLREGRLDPGAAAPALCRVDAGPVWVEVAHFSPTAPALAASSPWLEPSRLTAAGGCPRASDGRHRSRPDSAPCPRRLGEARPHADQPQSCQASPSPAAPSARAETRCQEVMSAPSPGEVGAGGRMLPPAPQRDRARAHAMISSFRLRLMLSARFCSRFSSFYRISAGMKEREGGGKGLQMRLADAGPCCHQDWEPVPGTW